MKKLLFLTAAMLLSFLAHSQEAESTGSYAELTVVPFFEFVPNYDFSENKLGANFGNTSIYTLFEGAFSDNVSWTLINHWFSLSDTEDIWWPYKYIGYSDTSNWLDYCVVDFAFNNWNISLGKDCISIGSYEYDEWDWDIPSSMASPMWWGLASYQWGAKVAYTLKDGSTTFGLQMKTSPFGEHPFGSGLWAYSADWIGEYGWFDCHWAVSALQHDKSVFTGLVTLAQRATFDNWKIVLEYNNFLGNEPEIGFGESFRYGTYIPSVTYSVSDAFSLTAKGIFAQDLTQLGAFANWYPIKDSDALRVHAALSYETVAKIISLNVGIRYNIGIHLW